MNIEMANAIWSLLYKEAKLYLRNIATQQGLERNQVFWIKLSPWFRAMILRLGCAGELPGGSVEPVPRLPSPATLVHQSGVRTGLTNFQVMPAPHFETYCFRRTWDLWNHWFIQVISWIPFPIPFKEWQRSSNKNSNFIEDLSVTQKFLVIFR